MFCSIRRAWTAAATAAVLGTAAPPARSATPPQTDPRGWGCRLAGAHEMTPGITNTPNQIAFTTTARLSSCRLPDSSIQSGTYHDAGILENMSCAGFGRGSASFTIVWENGRQSSGTITSRLTQPAVEIWKITAGEFAGAQAVDIHMHYFANPAEASACGSPAGVRHIRYEGAFFLSPAAVQHARSALRWGTAPVDGPPLFGCVLTAERHGVRRAVRV